MPTSFTDALSALDLTLPQPAAAVANYIPTNLSNDGTLYVSGQIPFVDGDVAYQGHLGGPTTLEDGYAAARICALNVLAQVATAVDNDLDRVQACNKLTVFVAATADFEQHAGVANGASDLIVAVLGERGRHARSAIGMASLPFNASVEVEAIFAVAND